MSVEMYNQLANANAALLQHGKRSQEAQKSVGVMLPLLEQKGLTITTDLAQATDLIAMVDEFKAIAGWVAYRDLVQTTIRLDRTDLLEAEFTNGKDTLLIKHEFGSSYRVTRMIETAADANNPQACRIQHMMMRNDLKGSANKIEYRLWYQQAKDGADKGRWLPLAQQFVGLVSDHLEPKNQGEEA